MFGDSRDSEMFILQRSNAWKAAIVKDQRISSRDEGGEWTCGQHLRPHLI